jgi:cobalt-zinc-cadmium efflux system membrane fusion protein
MIDVSQARLFVLSAVALTAACSSTPHQDAVTPAPANDAVTLSVSSQQLAGVVVEAAKATTAAADVEAVATVALDDTRTARIGALVEGVVAATHVGVGDRVSKGALLAGLHSHAVHDGWADYRKAVADERRLQQEVAFANDTVARTERLLADKASSVLEVERAKAASASTSQQLIAANAEVRRARESLEHLGIAISASPGAAASEIVPVQTPQSGVVLEKHVTAGTAVTPGTALFVISDISFVWVLAELDESALGRVKAGLPVHVSVSAYPEERFEATVTLIGDTINPTTRRVVVRCEAANADGRLKPGMFARVTLEGVRPEPVVQVPVDAVQEIGERRVVFVAGPSGQYVARDVETGAERDGHVDIRRGLAAGDRVVVRGAFLLKSQLLASPAGES